MRITLFAHGSVPGVDAPLRRFSECYITQQIAEGRAFMLPGDSYHLPAAMCAPPKNAHLSREHKLEHGTFADAWGTAISGYAGPQVMQMRRTDLRMRLAQ